MYISPLIINHNKHPVKSDESKKEQTKGHIYPKFVQNIINEIIDQYLYADLTSRPWIIGFSGGKDSTVMLQLVWKAVEQRADYGKGLLKGLSQALTQEFGRGFSVTSLQQMKLFYQAYQKQQTLSATFNLSWSHYLTLIRIEDENERKFYEIESAKNNWSVRELKRQFDSALYTRLPLSRDKEKVKKLSIVGNVITKPQDIIKG